MPEVELPPMPDERERLMESRPLAALPKGLDEAANAYIESTGAPVWAYTTLKTAFVAGAAWRERSDGERSEPEADNSL